MTDMWLLIRVAAAILCGFAGKRMRVPAGPMVGSMVGTIVCNLLSGQTIELNQLKVVLQLLSGAMIGSQISKKNVLELKKVLLPTGFLIGCMAMMNIVFGLFIYRCSNLDVATSLFSVAPGGASDMAIISQDLGATAFYVAILQLVRILVIMSGMPPLIKWLLKRHRSKTNSVEESAEKSVPGQNASWEPVRFGLLLTAAAVGGIVFHAFGVLAGMLIGAMLLSGGYCVWRGKVYFPSSLKTCMQFCSGTYIGSTIDWDHVAAIPDLLIPALIMCVGIYSSWYTVAKGMNKLFHVDPDVCLIASVPGGIQEMALLAEDLQADTPKIAIMMTIRMVAVIVLFPVINQAVIVLLQ